jgi:hypothetical protein
MFLPLNPLYVHACTRVRDAASKEKVFCRKWSQSVSRPIFKHIVCITLRGISHSRVQGRKLKGFSPNLKMYVKKEIKI